MKNLYTLCLIFTLTSNLFAQPANDDLTDALSININGLEAIGNNNGATEDTYGSWTPPVSDISLGGENLHNSVWYKFTGNGNPVSISTCSPTATFDTDLAVMELDQTYLTFFGIAVPGNGVGAFSGPNTPACNYNGGSGNLALIDNFETTVGVEYYIRVSSHFLNDTGDFGVIVEDLAVAPIVLKGFWADTWEKGNTINWETSSEENVLWHVIERSANGFGDWQEVGKLVSESAARNGAFYELVDNQPFNTTYYRLRTVDYDTSEQLSEVISVKRDRPEFEITKVYPNPIMEGEVTIQIDSDRNEDINIRIVDVSGQTIQKFEYPIRDGLNEMKIDVTDFRSGVYFVQFQSRQGYSTRKIFKQE